MDGAHDMGGAKGFGPVVPEPNEPVFHGEWERRAFALTVAMSRPGGWNIDMSRFARENRPPEDYLSKSYFQIWLAGLETLMIERGLVTPEEIEAGKVLSPPKPAVKSLPPHDVVPTIRRGASTERAATSPALFAVGETVRMKEIHPPTHTRLPQYVRGHLGTIELNHGCHVFADLNSLGVGENPQWLYTVRFDGPELWGNDTDPTLSISVDAWESYLERVG
ncbi:nitrile hydratase subunit beta [Bradyrhizobium sp. AUGA SZCCT0431]|uniref:nitrile hydratase subunit beta n=1 Tax=Bradyrhizobium sp. AUGA SZCCT0431 TaxID=2807674 RepID=UPI001BADF59D|nr:nitrile hydratase subunit beta [Bradyrhizobium sp. AUGA SZCCT0431]MBR1145043.1 nitrile hydratase subunit beta [Bradyrhizobium sp. AUGA SZCCT0431]